MEYSFRAVLVDLLDDIPPFKKALHSDYRFKWLIAISEELRTLFDANMFTTVERLIPGEKVMPTGIILKLNRDQHGYPARHNAHVVVRGSI